MVLLHNLQTTRHSTHHTKIILIQKGNKFIIKDKVIPYKGDFNFQLKSKYVHKYTNKVVSNKHETSEKFFSSTMSKKS